MKRLWNASYPFSFGEWLIIIGLSIFFGLALWGQL